MSLEPELVPIQLAMTGSELTGELAVGTREEGLGRKTQWLAIVVTGSMTVEEAAVVRFGEEGAHNGASEEEAANACREYCIAAEHTVEEFPGVVGNVEDGIAVGRRAGCKGSCTDYYMLPALEDSEDSGCNVVFFLHLAAYPALPADGDRSSPCRRGMALPKRRVSR